MDNRNEPTDMDLIDSPRRTPTPPPLSACEQILQNKAQLQKMETFKKFKLACIAELQAMPDHHPDEPFYRRAVSELQEVEETINLAVSDLASFPPCVSPGCPHHDSGLKIITPKNSPDVTPTKRVLNLNSNRISNKRKEESDFEYPPLRKTTKKQILNIPNDSISISPNRFSLPSDSNIEEITGSQNAIPVVTPKPPSATGPTPSGNQNPVSTLPPPVMLRITETVVLKGLPRNFKVEEIQADLEELGFTPEKVNQLIGRRSKQPIPRLELQCKLKQRQASFNFANILNLHIAFPDSPTRFGHNSANTIDFALIKNFYYPYTIKSINDLYSDHNPVFLNFDFKLKVESSNPRAITTNWKDFRINLNNNFSLFNYYPNNINNTNDLETKITEFTEAVVATHSHASQPIVNAHRNYTPNHINQLIKHKNNLRKRYQQTLNPFYKTLCNRAQANLKKELKIYSNDTWNARLEALNTTDNSLWEAQRFLKNKRSQIPTLNCATGMAVTDPQKANLLANTIKNNFIENNRMQDNYDQDDEVVTSTVNTFLSSPLLLKLNLPCLMKLLTSLKILALKRPRLINPNQYGFTNKLSTLHPLLRLTESISEGFQKKEEHGSGLSGYPESLRPCLDFRTHFQTNYLRYSFSPHSPHPLVSH
ncbi:RNA-directed DNA polymerase from mobile element jockey [Trichonephila clavipes]|nr:RNA-directed DNA polymerase from mobile element jockey [Trichonephila clavipes]